MIELYWAWIGGPLARLLGPWVDAIAFPISEVLLLLSLGLILFRIMTPFLGFGMPWVWWLGPGLLAVMAFSQGVTPLDWVPSVFRDAPHERAGAQKVDQSLEEWKLAVQTRVLSFSSSSYTQAAGNPNLKEVHRAVTRVLEGLSYPAGREVTRIKEMAGLTRVMGLAYGGPAYHDVVTGEVVMASEEDLPRTKVSRWLTVVHEVAHAQGFTREMDAEVLTWLILREMESPFGSFCADLQALSKGSWKWEGPPEYQKEKENVLKARKALNQPVVSFLKDLWRKGGLQNSGEKYGQVKDPQPPANHPFFGVVLKWDQFSNQPIEKGMSEPSEMPKDDQSMQLPDL